MVDPMRCLAVAALMFVAACGGEPGDGVADDRSSDVPVTAFSDVLAWAKDVVWYQIFVERFRNGDPSNDPTPGDIEGSWPHVRPAG